MYMHQYPSTSNHVQTKLLNIYYIYIIFYIHIHIHSHSPGVCGVRLSPSEAVRNFGVLLESDLLMSGHVSQLVSRYFLRPRLIGSCIRSHKLALLVFKSFHGIAPDYLRAHTKDPEWPSGLVPARHAGAPGSLPGRVGLSEINFSDLYCGWLGRIINVEYNTTQHNILGRGGLGVCSVPCSWRVAGSNPPQSCRVGTLGKSFTRNCSCASA